jgi:hypothetical protein
MDPVQTSARSIAEPLQRPSVRADVLRRRHGRIACPRIAALFVVLLVTACQPSPPDGAGPARPRQAPSAAPADTAPRPPSNSAPQASSTPRATIALPSMQLPPGPIYACDVAGVRTPIEYPGNVEALCRRHPEMGPCQYERNACRHRGGRVYTSNGEEVTAAVEAEYDRKVRRVRFQADGTVVK